MTTSREKSLAHTPRAALTGNRLSASGTLQQG
jgi:hypothetical protein